AIDRSTLPPNRETPALARLSSHFASKHRASTGLWLSITVMPSLALRRFLARRIAAAATRVQWTLI
ncbi:MAG: hypothetical protein ABL931_14700, partial [Usitatibacteraceae bacterium]